MNQVVSVRLFTSLLAATLTVASVMPGVFSSQAQARVMPNSPTTFYPNLIADVAEGIAPSVVNIDVEKSVPNASAAQDLSRLPFSDQILRRFFGFEPGNGDGSFTPFGNGGGGNSGSGESSPRIISGNGSGMIINKDGYILTNNHVISTAEKMTVKLNDGRQFTARLVGRDTYADIAVIKIDAPNLTPVSFGNSDKLRPGEWVIAVGSPLGFDHTVTQGIVSALSRRIPDLNSNLSFIQTDAAINPGNSGGPLTNLQGEVVGINTAISGRGQNIGFAIPINTVKEIANTLIAGKPVVRPWIGVSMMELNPELAKHIGLAPDTKGIVIAQVMENSPAYKAGLMQGDVIRKIDGTPILKPEGIQQAIRARELHSTIMMDILRNGHPISVGVVSEPLPESSDGQAYGNPVRPQLQPGPQTHPSR
jgi:serine protease Do